MLQTFLLPIQSHRFRERFQYDLIDMVKEKFEASRIHYGIQMKFILHVKDHFTKLSYLTALPNKSSRVIASELNHLFSLIGVPVILHSDNEQVLINSSLIMGLLIRLNPAMDTLRSNITKNNKLTTIETVTERCRVPRDQGSVEVGNKFAKQILNCLRQMQLIEKSDIIILGVPHKNYKDLKIPSSKIIYDMWDFLTVEGVN